MAAATVHRPATVITASTAADRSERNGSTAQKALKAAQPMIAKPMTISDLGTARQGFLDQVETINVVLTIMNSGVIPNGASSPISGASNATQLVIDAAAPRSLIHLINAVCPIEFR